MQKMILVVSAFLLASPVLAQQLSLFEPVDATAPNEKFVQPQAGAVVQNGQPAYTLRSSTRIGDSYTVELVDRQGKVTKVNWKKGEHATVAGGFAVEDIQQRNVILAQPGNDPCVSAPAKGVNCLAPARTKLSFALAPPLAPAAQNPQQKGVNPNGAPQAPGVVQNPFEAAAQAQAAAQGRPNGGGFVNPFNGNQINPEQQAVREARQRARAEQLNQNQAGRIPDGQIPAGQRRVTTPFGDRLVPAGQ